MHGRSLAGRSVISIAPYLINHSYSTRDSAVEGIPFGYLNLVEDILLHEMMHQSVDQTCEKTGSPHPADSHNNEYWTDECNRIALILGFKNYQAGLYRSRRKPSSEGGGTYKASPDDCVDYQEVFQFPIATYHRLGGKRYAAGIKSQGNRFDLRARFTLKRSAGSCRQ